MRIFWHEFAAEGTPPETGGAIRWTELGGGGISAWGLPVDATREQVKSAYRRLAWATHPDRADESERAAAEARMKRLNQEYATLLAQCGDAQ